jgi:hypothetical protein
MAKASTITKTEKNTSVISGTTKKMAKEFFIITSPRVTTANSRMANVRGMGFTTTRLGINTLVTGTMRKSMAKESSS